MRAFHAAPSRTPARRPRVARLLALALMTAGLAHLAQGCATLTPVDGSVCGDGVVGLEEECDSPNGGNAKDGFCGTTGTPFACKRVPDVDGACLPGFIASNGRCFAPSGTFEAPQTLEDGLAIIGSADFDGDGQTDLLYQSATGLGVSFFESGTPLEPAFQFDAFVSQDIFPSVDANGDAARDLIIPNAVRDALGVFIGRGERSFEPVFQPSLSLENAVRMVALPPSGVTGFSSESRFLRQLGVFEVVDGALELCLARADGVCEPFTALPAIPGVTASNIADVVVLDPLFIPSADGESGRFELFYSPPNPPDEIGIVRVIEFAGALPSLKTVSFPNALPQNLGTPSCFETCHDATDDGGLCQCAQLTGLRVLAFDVAEVPTGLDETTTVVLAGAQIETPAGRGVTILTHVPGSDRFDGLAPLSSNLVLEAGSKATNLQLADFDGEGIGDAVITVATDVPEDDPSYFEFNLVLVGSPNPALFGGPIGRATVGDINGDGFDDILGNDPESFSGRSYVMFGGTTVPFVGAPLDAAGATERHVIADLDGDGINDVVAVGRDQDFSTTPDVGSGSEDGEVASTADVDHTLSVLFGQPNGFPVRGLTFTTKKDFEQVLPLKLELRSPLGDPNADGVDDLAILLRDEDGGTTGSLVGGDPYGFLSSPFYLHDAVLDALDRDDLSLLGQFGLPTPLPLGDGRNVVALLFYGNYAEGHFLSLIADEAGQLALERPSENLGAWIPVGNLVVFETSPLRFGLFGWPKAFDGMELAFGVRTFELGSDGEVGELAWEDFEGYGGELVTGAIDGLDGRLFVMSQDAGAGLEPLGEDGRQTIRVRQVGDPDVAIDLTSFPGRAQWLGPGRLQLGEYVLKMDDLVAGATAASVLDQCFVLDGPRYIDPSFPVSTQPPTDLNDDGLPDALVASPMAWSFQLPGDDVCAE